MSCHSTVEKGQGNEVYIKVMSMEEGLELWHSGKAGIPLQTQLPPNDFTVPQHHKSKSQHELLYWSVTMPNNDITVISVCCFGLALGLTGPLARVALLSFPTERGQQHLQFCFRTSLSQRTMARFILSSQPHCLNPYWLTSMREKRRREGKWWG